MPQAQGSRDRESPPRCAFRRRARNRARPAHVGPPAGRRCRCCWSWQDPSRASPPEPGGRRLAPEGFRLCSEMDHFVLNDNTPSLEWIIALYATVWTVSIALRPLWRLPSAAVSPRPPAASLARRPPLRARLASSKRGSGCDFSTAPRARSDSPRLGGAFWLDRIAW